MASTTPATETTEVRPLVLGNGCMRKYDGMTYDATCPFCQFDQTVRKSSLNGKGKRCICGALLKGHTAAVSQSPRLCCAVRGCDVTRVVDAPGFTAAAITEGWLISSDIYCPRHAAPEMTHG